MSGVSVSGHEQGMEPDTITAPVGEIMPLRPVPSSMPQKRFVGLLRRPTFILLDFMDSSTQSRRGADR